MPAPGGGQFAAPLADGRNFRVAREGISPPAAPEGFIANAADFAKSIPHGIMSGISSALSATGAAANAEMSQPENPDPTPQETQQALEDNVTGATHRPEGNAGKLGAAIGEALGNPTSYLGPGSLPLKVGAAILSAAGGEAGRQAAEGTKYETPAQLSGGLVSGVAAMKTLGALRPTGITPRGTTPRTGPQPPARPPDKAAAQSDRMNSGARESGPSSLEDKQRPAKTDDIAAVTRNALKGRAFEEEGLRYLAATHTEIRPQVSVRPYVDASGTLADYVVRLDAVSVNRKGALQLTDFKSSDRAGYTRNQAKGYPLVQRYGGQVVGESGGAQYPHGFQIRPTEVTTIRPRDLKAEK
jgi:hypothetical protein